MGSIFDSPEQRRKPHGSGGSSAFDDDLDLDVPDIEDTLDEIDQALEDKPAESSGCGICGIFMGGSPWG